MFELSAIQKQLQATAREFAKKEIAPRAAEVDLSEKYPWKNIELLTNQGFMGMTIPKEYGGKGMTYLDVVLVIEEIAKVCGVSARIVVEANMGAIGAVMKYGTEVQKKLAAEHVLSGDKPAICITEPEAGSAATEMSTRADHKGDRYILNGMKHWITGGGVSKFHLIFARVYENNESQGIAGFIALRGTKGLKTGKREPSMGLRGIPETQIILEDLEISKEKRVNELSEDQLLAIRNAIGDMISVEGELRGQNSRNIKRLMDIGSYRGLRHRKGLPARGQNTKNNARTRKGKKKTIAGKKKATV